MNETEYSVTMRSLCHGRAWDVEVSNPGGDGVATVYRVVPSRCSPAEVLALLLNQGLLGRSPGRRWRLSVGWSVESDESLTAVVTRVLK